MPIHHKPNEKDEKQKNFDAILEKRIEDLKSLLVDPASYANINNSNQSINLDPAIRKTKQNFDKFFNMLICRNCNHICISWILQNKYFESTLFPLVCCSRRERT